MARSIVLLGGVNVGGHRLDMSTLRSVLGAAGCTDVVTYIQSGNAVVTPPSPEPGALAAMLSEVISSAAGYSVPVVLRTRDELAAVVDANPYPGAEGKQLHVVFMAEEPPATILDSLDLHAFLPEECTLIGRDLYLHLPNGMGRARLPVALEKAGRRTDPSGVGTSRNWNTVLKLLDLADRRSGQVPA
ncbi:MAG: DUF1697 domain-containing protein [Propionicimonas sp.]|jgi:uncharacterized protein (DUF1697 family)